MSRRTTHLKIRIPTRKDMGLTAAAAVAAAFIVPFLIFREFHFWAQTAGILLGLFYFWKGERDRRSMQHAVQASADEFFSRLVQRGLIIVVSLLIGAFVFGQARSVFITALIVTYAVILLYELTLIDHETLIEETRKDPGEKRSHLPYEDEAP